MKPIVLDTNVISNAVSRHPNPLVEAWFLRQQEQSLYLTATVLCKLRAGVHALAAGRRRRFLEAWLADLTDERFADRILPLDAAAADHYGRMLVAA